MKMLLAASALIIGTATMGATTVAQAEDVGAAIARGAIRGALGDNGYRDDYRRDRFEGRSGFNGDCRTVTVQRDTPYGPETRTRRTCD